MLFGKGPARRLDSRERRKPSLIKCHAEKSTIDINKLYSYAILSTRKQGRKVFTLTTIRKETYHDKLNLRSF